MNVSEAEKIIKELIKRAEDEHTALAKTLSSYQNTLIKYLRDMKV